MQKIYICNDSIYNNAKILLNIDNQISIHANNWFETNYNDILHACINIVLNKNNIMFLLSAGMGAKVLAMDLHKKFSNSIIIDLGSSMDFVSKGIDTRGNSKFYSYLELKFFFDNL